jgi:hypothetical protein
MTFEEVYEERPRVGALEARREVEKHGSTWADFQKDCGTRETYDGWDVLAWLGY